LCIFFSDAWNKSVSVGRVAKGFECNGIKPFSVDIVPEQKSTPSLFEPSSRIASTLLPLSLPPKQQSSCRLVALLVVICSQNRDTADATASNSNTTGDSASRCISSVKKFLPTPEKKTSSRKRKTKYSVHLTSDQNLEEPEIKGCIFPTKTKQTSSGESNLVNTTTENRLIFTNKTPEKDDECGSCFLNYYTANSMKNVARFVARTVMSGTTKYALMRKAKGSSFAVDATDRNYTTK
jgi:hypothetical protein